MANDKALTLITLLSEFILDSAQQCGSEQRQPGVSPDDSDDYIASRKQRIAVLRQLRQTFENEITGFLP